MTTLTLPERFVPSRFEMERVSMGFVSRSPVTGSAQVRPMFGWFWRVTVTFPARTHEEMLDLAAFFHGLGVGDLLVMGDPIVPVPRGTRRGSPTVSGDHVAGDRTIDMPGDNGKTYLAGDRLKIGSYLYMVQQDVTFGSSTTAVPIAGGLLADVTSGTAITWDHPTINWIRTSTPRAAYVPGYAEALSVDLEQA